MKWLNQRSIGRGFTLIELMAVVTCVALIGMIFIGGMPVNFRHRRASHHRIKCVNNLKQMGLAFKVFAGDNEDRYPYFVTNGIAYREESRAWIHFQAMSNELQSAKVLLCPDDRGRVNNQAENFGLGALATSTSLVTKQNESTSYFVGIGTDESTPQGILSGDRNIAWLDRQPAYRSRVMGSIVIPANSCWSTNPVNYVHGPQGNILLSDGSVQQASDNGLQAQLKLASDRYGTNVNRLLFPQ